MVKEVHIDPLHSLAIMQFLWSHVSLRSTCLFSEQLKFLVRLIVPFHNAEIQTFGPKIRSSSHASPTVFSHNIHPTPQLRNPLGLQGAILNSNAPNTPYLTSWNGFKPYHVMYQLPLSSLNITSICNFIANLHSLNNTLKTRRL